MDSTLLQVVVGGGGIIGGGYALIKYLTSENRKSQETFLSYIESKNGHMERMAKDFTSSTEKTNEAVGQLTEQIIILNERVLPLSAKRRRKMK